MRYAATTMTQILSIRVKSKVPDIVAIYAFLEQGAKIRAESGL
jgi:hypothetical protein